MAKAKKHAFLIFHQSTNAGIARKYWKPGRTLYTRIALEVLISENWHDAPTSSREKLKAKLVRNRKSDQVKLSPKRPSQLSNSHQPLAPPRGGLEPTRLLLYWLSHVTGQPTTGGMRSPQGPTKQEKGGTNTSNQGETPPKRPDPSKGSQTEKRGNSTPQGELPISTPQQNGRPSYSRPPQKGGGRAPTTRDHQDPCKPKLHGS